jgi:flagellar biosynthesis protein FlhF
MNVQRFTAPTSREAMAKARMVFGDSAVILSSRNTEHGFEVVATAEENLDALAHRSTGAVHSATASNAPVGRRPSGPAPKGLAPSAPMSRTGPVDEGDSARGSVRQDTETLAMSTLSFQDYVRERMLKKRRDMLQGSAASRMAEPTVTPAMAGAVNLGQRPRGTQTGAVSKELHPSFKQSPAPIPIKAPSRDGNRFSGELGALKEMIEERFNTLNWLGQSRQNPIHSNLMLKLIRSGYSPALARAVLERMPNEMGADDSFRWILDVLARNLRVADDAASLADEGGIFALVGPTGVGKTTTAAKLAAQCVKAYGPQSVGLITLDSYKVGGYEQLRTYGRMLGVVAHLAHDGPALQDLLSLLANKRMVIIDTMGLSQKDPRIQEMLDLLANPRIKKLLVLNAASHGDTLDDVYTAFRGEGKSAAYHGVILSKLDEAVKLGPALDTLIRHQAVLRGVANGQRVPEDWLRPDTTGLVRQSMGTSGKSAYDPQASELGFFFAQPTQPAVTLDAWHA